VLSQCRGRSGQTVRDEEDFSRRNSKRKDFSGRGEDFFSKAEERIGKAKQKISRAEEKIGRAEDFLGLFFLSPCKAEGFLGLAEDFVGKEKERNSRRFGSSGERLALCGPGFPVRIEGLLHWPQ